MENNDYLLNNGDIKVTKSLFSRYENEKMIYDGRISPIRLEDIMFKVKRGHINGEDFIILKAISELQYATSRMITMYLHMHEPSVDLPQIKVQNRLKFMNKTNIISRFKFQSSEGEAITRVYCLERAAKYLLLSRNYECNWKDTDNTLPIEMVKDILARNQLLMIYRHRLNNIEEYRLNPRIRVVSNGKILRPHIQISLKINGEVQKILFHSIRSYDNSLSRAVEDFKSYQAFYDNFVPSAEYVKPPQVIFICETDPHIGYVYRKIIYKNNIKFRNMPFLFTTDLRTIENLDTSIITDYIKDNTLNLKILQNQFFQYND